jgi:cell division protein FtsA
MLDKFKTMGQSLVSKAADKVAEVNAKVGQQSKANEDDQYVVALDVGTEFVKALIGRIKDDNIEIIGVGRAHQELSDMQAGAIADIESVVANCDEALSQAEQQAGVSVRTAVLGIAGELVKGTTTTVRVTRKQPDKALDLPEVEKIIKLVQERAEAKAKKQLAWELGGKEVEVRLVNSALVGIEIDGYKVTSPIGFQGRDVVVQLYTAFAPMIHIGALERTAEKLDLDLLAVAAEPFAVARSVIGNDANASMSAILMDVGGGTTDIAVPLNAR